MIKPATASVMGTVPLENFCSSLKTYALKLDVRDFPGGPVVKTLHFQCRGHGFDPWSGN